MPSGGYLRWDARHFKEVMYLDGKSWTEGERFWSFGAKHGGADSGLIVRQGDNGVHGIVRRMLERQGIEAFPTT